MLNFCDFIQVYVFTTNHHLKLRSLILNLGFCCSFSYNLINQGQTLHGKSARLPPISHQYVMYLCPSYDAGLTCTKMQITLFRFETKSIGQVRNTFSYHIKRSL